MGDSQSVAIFTDYAIERRDRYGKVAYGKFFDKKAGFISLEWLPYFANYRRSGYDFDATAKKFNIDPTEKDPENLGVSTHLINI